MSKQKSKVVPTAATTVKEQGFLALQRVLRGTFQRRQFIICAVGVLVVALLLWLLLPLIPRTAKPVNYLVGEVPIKAITQVVGYRKVTEVTQSLSGLGRAQAGNYTYRAGSDPAKDIAEYCALLQKEYGAVPQTALPTGESGTVTLVIPSPQEGRQVTMKIAYDKVQYHIAVDEQALPTQQVVSQGTVVNVTPEQAKELLMTLTKKETGFTADISVYTTTLEPDKATVEGWDYYVFTVVADYSATRIEYRGTFYVSVSDGVILSYNKDTDTTSRLRGSEGAVEEVPKTEETPE